MIIKHVVVLLLGMLLGACGATPTPAAPSRHAHVEDATALERKTVAVFLDGAICSGVWVSEREIVTANHCVDDLLPGALVAYATREDIYPGVSLRAASDASVRPAFVSRQDPAHDLALLVAPAPPSGHGIAALHVGAVEPGMFAQAMGHPIGLWFSYSSGDVAAVREKDMGDGRLVVWIQSTAPIAHGSSGGGLFDAEGRLMGIAAAVVESAPGVALFVPATYVAALLAP